MTPQSIDFGMAYRPAYANRFSHCSYCTFGIVAGSRIMVGSKYTKVNGVLIVSRQRCHVGCFEEARTKAIKDWFFENDYSPVPQYTKTERKEIKAIQDRVRYLRRKGGDVTEEEELEIIRLEEHKAHIQSKLRKDGEE